MNDSLFFQAPALLCLLFKSSSRPKRFDVNNPDCLVSTSNLRLFEGRFYRGLNRKPVESNTTVGTSPALD